MKNYTTFVRMRSGDHLGNAKNVEKGRLTQSNLTLLLIAIDTKGFRRMKEEGQIYKMLPDEGQIYKMLPKIFCGYLILRFFCKSQKFAKYSTRKYLVTIRYQTFLCIYSDGCLF